MQVSILLLLENLDKSELSVTLQSLVYISFCDKVVIIQVIKDVLFKTCPSFSPIQVSQGFALLRQHVPQAARKKKMSKVETLRCAVEYIRGLQLLLDSEPPTQLPGPTPTTAVHSFHHHQQLQQQQTQVFLQPPHAIEPHILKLPVADETFHSPVSLRYASHHRPRAGPVSGWIRY